MKKFDWRKGNNNWATSTYAGRCTFGGDANGPLQDAKFNFPISAAQFNEKIIVFEQLGQAIREINVITGTVVTAFRSSFMFIGMALGEKGSEFYGTVNHGILQIFDQKESWLVGSNSSGSRTGGFSSAEFNQPANIQWLTTSVLLVTDSKNNELKVINLKSEKVNTVCSGEFNKRKI